MNPEKFWKRFVASSSTLENVQKNVEVSETKLRNCLGMNTSQPEGLIFTIRKTRNNLSGREAYSYCIRSGKFSSSCERNQYRRTRFSNCDKIGQKRRLAEKKYKITGKIHQFLKLSLEQKRLKSSITNRLKSSDIVDVIRKVNDVMNTKRDNKGIDLIECKMTESEKAHQNIILNVCGKEEG